MADLLGIGSIATGVGSLMGGFGASSAAKKGRKEAKRQFNIQMNESIQRRVADARAAGIHPLFALGASVGASPTMHAGGSSTGGGLGEGLAEAGRAAQRYSAGKTAAAVASAQIRSANAQATRDEAEAQLSLSRSKRIEQDLISRGHDGVRGDVRVVEMGDQPVFGPTEYVAPQAMMSKQPGVQSGRYPATQEWVFPDGHVVRTYANELQMDELKQLDMAWERGKFRVRDGYSRLKQWLKRHGIPYRSTFREHRDAR